MFLFHFSCYLSSNFDVLYIAHHWSSIILVSSSGLLNLKFAHKKHVNIQGLCNKIPPLFRLRRQADKKIVLLSNFLRGHMQNGYLLSKLETKNVLYFVVWEILTLSLTLKKINYSDIYSYQISEIALILTI